MKILIFTTIVLVAAVQATRDWSKIKPQLRAVIPRMPAVAPRVVGGQEAEPHGVPYQAAVISSSGGFCGGSIIDIDVILTAAHCVDAGDSAEVIIGAHNIFEEEPHQQVIQSRRIVIHENWDPFAITDDIAIVLLSKNIKLDNTAKIVELNRAEENIDDEEALVSGWGRYSDASGSLSSILRYAVGNILSNAGCKLYFGDYIKSTNVCLDGSEGKGSCNGDSGGPLFIIRNDKPIQAGIVSFGSAAGCEQGYPSVFTRVSKYIDWININING